MSRPLCNMCEKSMKNCKDLVFQAATISLEKMSKISLTTQQFF